MVKFKFQKEKGGGLLFSWEGGKSGGGGEISVLPCSIKKKEEPSPEEIKGE